MHALISHRTAGRSTYLLLFYAYCAFGVLLQVFPPLLDRLTGEFGVSHQLASLVMTLFMAPLVLFCVPAGVLVDRLGIARTGRLSFAAMLVGGLLTALAGSFPLLLLGRIVSGMGGGLLLITLLKIATQSFGKQQRGLALGVFAAGLPVGTGLAFNLLAPLGQALDWRPATLVATLIVGSAFLVFEALVGRGRVGAADAGGHSLPVNPALALTSAELWRLAATTTFGYAAILAFTTWAPTILVGYAGVAPWVAALITSLLLVIDIPFAPLWGGLSDRLGRRKPFIVGAFAVYLAGSLAVPFVAVSPGIGVPGLLVVITFMGVGCAMFFPTALAIPAEVVVPELAGAAYGLFFTFQVFGMMLGPLLLGYVLDLGTATDAFHTMSVVTLAGLLAALTLRSR
ncbi:MAG: MFS transporter [Chloroflexi bacterium]|nr:MFS transporter [Chloroflexota bacterium]